MIETVEFKARKYPAFQASGFAARFAFPFAYEICDGVGYDIGCNRHEWRFPNSIAWDIAIHPEQDALNLPEVQVDYIFSSHCLEHLPDWVAALEHWTTRIRKEGVLFLYLPHPEQEYWKPWNNRKHTHSLSPELISNYLRESGHYRNIFVSERDLNHSFIAIAERR